MRTKTKTEPLLNEQQPVDRLPAVRKPRATAPTAEPVRTMQPAVPTTPMDLLRIVTQRGASVEEIGKFMDLMERQQKNEAQQAMVRAMTAFKKNPPDIYKTAEADFTTSKGRTTYSYATLGDICDKIIAALAEHGISHDWAIEQPGSGPDANMIVVTCTLTHEMGGSKSATFKAPPDNTGSKNAIQSIGSSVTYASRYSLLAACGIAVKAQGDDDGAAAGEPQAKAQPGADSQVGQHKIDKPNLDRAIKSIKSDDYSYGDLVEYYALTPEQLAYVRAELGMDAAAEAKAK